MLHLVDLITFGRSWNVKYFNLPVVYYINRYYNSCKGRSLKVDSQNPCANVPKCSFIVSKVYFSTTTLKLIHSKNRAIKPVPLYLHTSKGRLVYLDLAIHKGKCKNTQVPTSRVYCTCVLTSKSNYALNRLSKVAGTSPRYVVTTALIMQPMWTWL